MTQEMLFQVSGMIWSSSSMPISAFVMASFWTFERLLILSSSAATAAVSTWFFRFACR